MPTEPFGNPRLAGIEEILLPEPVSLFPQSQGWGWLAAFLFVWVLWRSAVMIRRWHTNRYRRVALKRLSQIETLFVAGQTAHKALRDVPMLLKWTALQAAGRESTAQLSGEHWVAFLNVHCRSAKFKNTDISRLNTLAYAPAAHVLSVNDDEWHNLLTRVRHWIVHHDVTL